MPTQSIYQNDAPAGCERYGSSPGQGVAAVTPSHIQPGTEPASPGGSAYFRLYPTCTMLRADGEFCQSPKVKGMEICINHLRRLKVADTTVEFNELEFRAEVSNKAEVPEESLSVA